MSKGTGIRRGVAAAYKWASHLSVIQWLLTPLWTTVIWGQFAAGLVSVGVFILAEIKALPIALTIPSVLAAYVLVLVAWNLTAQAIKASTRPSFDIQISDDSGVLDTASHTYVQICTITVKNLEDEDLVQKCLVQLEAIGEGRPMRMPLPLVLRTEGQIMGERTGRFNLSSGQTKKVPIIYAAAHRPLEWYLFDETGQEHHFVARDTEIVVAVYGGTKNCKAKIRIVVARPDWIPTCSIVERGAV